MSSVAFWVDIYSGFCLAAWNLVIEFDDGSWGVDIIGGLVYYCLLTGAYFISLVGKGSIDGA